MPRSCRTTTAEWIYYLRSLNGLQLADYRGWRSIADYLALLDRRDGAERRDADSLCERPRAGAGWGRAPADDAQMRHMQQDGRRRRWSRRGRRVDRPGLHRAVLRHDRRDRRGLRRACDRWQRDLRARTCATRRGVLAGVQGGGRDRPPGGNAGPHLAPERRRRAERRRDARLHRSGGGPTRSTFSFDVYPYLPGSTMLNYFLPYEVWEDGPLGVRRSWPRPDLRRRLAAQLDDHRLELTRFASPGCRARQQPVSRGRWPSSPGW